MITLNHSIESVQKLREAELRSMQTSPTQEQIRDRAFELYEERKRSEENGDACSDWLIAEALLRASLGSRPTGTGAILNSQRRVDLERAALQPKNSKASTFKVNRNGSLKR